MNCFPHLEEVIKGSKAGVTVSALICIRSVQSLSRVRLFACLGGKQMPEDCLQTQAGPKPKWSTPGVVWLKRKEMCLCNHSKFPQLG